MAIDFKMKAPIPEWEPLFEQGRTSVVERFSVLKDVTPTEAMTMTDVLDEMDNQGVTHSVILGRNNQAGSSNAELLDFLSSNEGERFFGFIGIEDMTVEEAVETIHKYAATGRFHGVAANPAKIRPFTPIGDPSLDPIFEACMEHDLPFCMTLSMLITLLADGADYDYIHPRQLIRVLEKYPDLDLIISHAAWPFVQESIAVAVHYPNLYLCPDFYMGFPGAEQYLEAADKGLEDQVLYASCYPNVPYDYAMKHYRSGDLPPDIMAKIMEGNARRLLKMKE
jgi:predicted TIM-barrel fold metal-dependent hydrolase